MKHVFRLAAAALIASMAFVITGCGLFSSSSEFNPSVTSVYIRRDRTVCMAEVVDFDNSKFSEPRYFESELREFVYDAIRTYNKAQAGLEYVSADETEQQLPVALVSLEIQNNVARMFIDFANTTHLLQFYGTTDAVPVRSLIVGTVADGLNSNLKFENMLDKDGASASFGQISDDDDYYLVAVKGDVAVQTEGDIKYYSKSLTKKDDNTVLTSGSDVNYIIFK